MLAGANTQARGDGLLHGITHLRAAFFVLFLATLVAPTMASNVPRTFEEKGPDSQYTEKPELRISALQQVYEKGVYVFEGQVQLETAEWFLEADRVTYDSTTGDAQATGNVHYYHKIRGEQLWAEAATYNLRSGKGKFYRVRGITRAKVETRPGILTTENPFYFEAEWVEKLEDRYILHQAWVTNCDVPGPLWKVESTSVVIIPGSAVTAKNAIFRLKGVPLFYFPFYYKSLKRLPRKSGFLSPTVGNSSRLGRMVGVAYYWAFHRSYDLTYLPQLFSQRGFAHNLEVRGKPTQQAAFGASLYAVNDRGRLLPDGRRVKEGGAFFTLSGQARLGQGWHALANVNLLSSFRFRQAFTQTFNEAVFSQVSSVGVLSRDWQDASLDVVYSRLENFQSIREGDRVLIRKAPMAEFYVKDRTLNSPDSSLPAWFSMEASAGLLFRRQPLLVTRQFTDRLAAQPRLGTILRLGPVTVVPNASVRALHYGARLEAGKVTGEGLSQVAGELQVEVLPPALAKVFQGPAWFSYPIKHTVEPRLQFRLVRGFEDPTQVIRFDGTDLWVNTSEAEIGLINRLYARIHGVTREVLSWEVVHKRFFDPDFGNIVSTGYRNAYAPSLDLTPYAFLAEARSYSPVISKLKVQPVYWFSMHWRTDYDPLRGRIVNSSLSTDWRYGPYFVSIGHNQVRSVPIRALGANEFLGLSPNANQFRGLLGIGNSTRPGWSAAFSAIYDFRQGVMQFATTQVTYNTECCGFSVQYRRFSFGARHENQFRVAFTIANVGSIGTLRKNERIY